VTGSVRTSPGRRSLLVLLAVLAVLGLALAVRVVSRPGRPEREPDVLFVPTPQEVVDRMLELAEVKTGDVLYDLGCGDGRIVVTAAKTYGVKAVGFDIDPQRIRESRENVRKNGVGDLVTIKQADIFQQDLRAASVVTLYLLPSLNVRLKPQLARLKPGSRIVSHAFDMKGAKPKKVEQVPISSGGEATIYLWVVPWEEDGAEDPGTPRAPPDGDVSGRRLPSSLHLGLGPVGGLLQRGVQSLIIAPRPRSTPDVPPWFSTPDPPRPDLMASGVSSPRARAPRCAWGQDHLGRGGSGPTATQGCAAACLYFLASSE
jgi:precorrin-6B methylase 2